MPDSPEKRDEQSEEMVAYLDGELSPEESLRVEQRLAADEAYRQKLQRMERAWNALDELPLTTVDDKFSRTTMTLAVRVAADEVREKTIALPTVRRRQRLSTVLTAVAAAALGFLVLRLVWRNPNVPLVADLPVIDNVDLYSQVRDVAFLQRLQNELTPDLRALSGDATDLAARQERFAVVSSPDERSAWLRELTDEDRTNLRARFNRFRDLPPDRQQQLRDLHAQIVAAPDAEKLEEAMFVYQQWLGGLPPARQFELRDMPTDERVQTIKRWSAEMRDDALFTLTEDELRSLFRQLREPLAALRPTGPRDQVRQSGRGKRDRKGGLFSQPLSQLRRELEDVFLINRAESKQYHQAVLAALPERTRQPFEELPPSEKFNRFLTWTRQYGALVGDISQEDLERFFADELNVETRAQLLSLPPGQMEQALKWRYRRQPNAGLAGPGWGGPGAGRGSWDRPWPPQGPPRGPGPGGPGPDGPRPDGPPPDGFGPRRDGFNRGPDGEFRPPRNERLPFGPPEEEFGGRRNDPGPPPPRGPEPPPPR